MLAKFLLKLLAMAFECYYTDAFCMKQEIMKQRMSSESF